ncbi:MAG: polyhydroxyalkanoic acid system family protein [Sphingomonadales bacterium]
MNQPLVVTLAHTLGKEEARRRIAGGMGRLAGYIPGGTANVHTNWEGDRLKLLIQAMGGEVHSHIDVDEDLVRVEVLLPALLGMFHQQIANLLSRKGAELLEDKRK